MALEIVVYQSTAARLEATQLPRWQRLAFPEVTVREKELGMGRVRFLEVERVDWVEAGEERVVLATNVGLVVVDAAVVESSESLPKSHESDR